MRRLIDHISSKLAFFPPTPATYALQTHDDGSGQIYIQPITPGLPRVPSAQVAEVPVPPVPGVGGGHSKIITAFVPGKAGGSPARRTILHSHGNAVDLGLMLPMYKELAKQLGCNVMGYDYTGYGPQPDPPFQPCESSSLADISAVFEHLLHHHKLRPQDIILYGQSVGSGPSAWLAARQPHVAGVVLHSPIQSGMRVLNPNMRFWPSWADVFPNQVYVPRIKAPVLVMHGVQDEVISITCGRALAALAKHPATPLWADGCGHQDLERSPDFIPCLQDFVAQCFPR